MNPVTDAMQSIAGIFERALPEPRSKAMSIVTDTEYAHDCEVAEASREAIEVGRNWDREGAKIRAEIASARAALAEIESLGEPRSDSELLALCRIAENAGLVGVQQAMEEAL